MFKIKLYILIMIVGVIAATNYQSRISFVNAATNPALPHADNAHLQDEHVAMFNTFTDPTKATDTALKSGDWADPSVWSRNQVPPNDAKVVIPAGITVTISSRIVQRLYWVRVSATGALKFDSAKDTELKVDTLAIAPNAYLEIGTKEKPIEADKTAHIQFIDRGAIDTAADPYLLSRGLISHTKTQIYGATKTSFVQTNGGPRSGEKTVIFTQPVNNWRVGDTVVIAGMVASHSNSLQSSSPDFWKTTWVNEDEKRTIASISPDNMSITVTEPFRYNHVPPQTMNGDILRGAIGNLSRNITFDSENTTDMTRWGHVMFMHTNNVVLGYAAFNRVGRTDKSKIVNDVVVEAGLLKSGTGTNRRGLYSVHFHRGEYGPAGFEAQVTGIAVDGANKVGWGLVNHASNVMAKDNVIYDIKGAAYSTEVGNERGGFIGNLAMRIDGSGIRIFEDSGNAVRIPEQVDRKKIHDMGHEGMGFWLEGLVPIIKDNIVAGARDVAIALWTEGFPVIGENSAGNQIGQTTFGSVLVPVSSLRKPELATYLFDGSIYGPTVFGIKDKKLYLSPRWSTHLLDGNSTFASRTAVATWAQTPTSPLPIELRPTIKNATLFNIRETAVGADYSGQMVMDNLKIYGSTYPAMNTYAGDVGGGNDPLITNSYIEGLNTGMISTKGVLIIENTTLDNKTNLKLRGVGSLRGPNPIENAIYLRNITFGTRILGKGPNIDIDLQPYHSVITPQPMYLDDKQIYWAAQVANYKIPTNFVGPAELIGKTNAELQAQYGFSLGGVIPPADAVPRSDIKNGLIGSKATYDRPEMISVGGGHNRTLDPSQSAGYVLEVIKDGKKYSAPPVDLKPGNNIVSITISNKTYGYLILSRAENNITDHERPEPKIKVGILNDKITGVTNGQEVTYSVVIRNEGRPTNAAVDRSLPAKSVVVSVPVPSGTRFVSASDGGKNVDGVVKWDIPELVGGQVEIRTVTVKVN